MTESWGGTKTVWGLRVLPDVLVGDGEGLAERLGRVEPDCWILLSRYRRLSRNRSWAHVQSAGDGRQQGVVTRIWTDTCPMRERDQEMGQRSRQAEGLDSSCCWRPTLQSFGQVHGTQDLLCDVWWPQTFQPLLPKQLQTDRQTDSCLSDHLTGFWLVLLVHFQDIFNVHQASVNCSG